MFRYIPMAVKNSLRNRRRSVLTILSIAASICLLGVLLAMYYMFYFREATPEQALRLITMNRISLANPLPVSYRDRIRQVPGVREVIVMQWFGGSYKDARDMKNFFARFAVEPDKMFTVYPEYQVPEDQKKAFLAERTACVVGRPLAERMGFKLGDRITIVGDIYPVTLEFTVRGIYDARRDNENLLFHYDYLRESLPPGRRDQVGTFGILAENAEAVPRISKAVDALFRNSSQQTKTDTERAFELSFLSYLGNVKMFLLSICGALTFTILLVSANTMAMSVRERVREIGILKTLGFTSQAILGIILGESVIIALIGGALGLLLAAGICDFIARAPTLFADVKSLAVNPSIAAIGLSLAAFIGLVSCALPAWSASRRTIVDSLRVTD
ncbi:MAG: FtsX-like permease family protein [Acidobacteria bacterium]|nr:FtsX-like permease family protein [Acidobacteriota bacterium]